MLSWISAFLKGRTQRVKINTSCSNPLNVNNGVPQGSVLGPTLFNIFINDLVEQILYSEIYLFADDVKIFSKNSVQLQHDLKAFIEWANIWQLEISFDKCCVLHLGNNNPMIDYYFNDVVLRTEHIVKDLGIQVSDKLSSTPHCNYLFTKCSRISTLISKSFLSKDIDLMLKAYKVYVLPILDYCSSVYTPHKISDINNLERIQRKFTKKALWDKSLSYENRLQKLHLSTLEVRRILSDLTLMYKILHGQIQSLSGIVNIKPSNKNTRQSRKVITKSGF